MNGNLDSGSKTIDQTEYPFDPKDGNSYTQVTQVDARVESLLDRHHIPWHPRLARNIAFL
ncbi:Uncharacterised protein [Yersinia enterocolitica]|nr:Uncharacterised protein [Yersinia enterocolitica]